VSAAVTQAVADFFTGLAEDVGDPDDVATYLARGIVAGHRRLAEHTTLQRVLRDEAEQLVPQLAEVMPIVVELVRAALVERLAADEVRPGVEVGEAADLLARLALSVMGAPGTLDLDDPEAVHRFVTDGLLAGVLERPA
jgi:hypothetical protein